VHIGIIGAGNIGGTLARKLVEAGYDVTLANSRGPESLLEIAAATGARAASVNEIGREADALVLSVPQRAVPTLAAAIFEHAQFVIDTNNYYPWRDGRVEAIDNGMPDSVWVAQNVRRPVVKAFNSIQSNSLANYGRPREAADRIALPLSGDDAAAMELASTLIDAIGFDPVIIGDLDASWRQQPGAPVYCTDLSAEELREFLPNAKRERLPELRDAAIRAFMESSPPPTPEQRREIFRRLYLRR
jgi:predicted dinucleotide-binding enzyme